MYFFMTEKFLSHFPGFPGCMGSLLLKTQWLMGNLITALAPKSRLDPASIENQLSDVTECDCVHCISVQVLIHAAHPEVEQLEFRPLGFTAS